MKRKNQNLEALTAMYQEQEAQFQAATLIVIACVMKKCGVHQIDISPADIEGIIQGEQLQEGKLPDGSLSYRFIPSPAALGEAIKEANDGPGQG